MAAGADLVVEGAVHLSSVVARMRAPRKLAGTLEKCFLDATLL